MSTSDRSFFGWAGLNHNAAAGNLVFQSFEPKPLDDRDIDVEITHSGLDGSDLHVLRSGWFPADYPVVAGHEFVGTVVKIGKNVSNVQLGDLVGIGGQSGSCLRTDCKACGSDLEQHCEHFVSTYNGRWPDGSKSYGGFAKHWRGDARYAIKIPKGIPPNEAAAMLCAGITVYAPMKRNGVGSGKRVGIIGIGGLGHLGLLFAKALGASKVVAISRTRTKQADAGKLGADAFVATEEDGWEDLHAKSLDVIISTVSGNKIPLAGYLNLLDIGGQFVQVGSPEDVFPEWMAHQLILNRISISGSYLGSRSEIRDMLELVAEKKIHPWVEDRPMLEINQALLDFAAGNIRYRIVFHN